MHEQFENAEVRQLPADFLAYADQDRLAGNSGSFPKVPLYHFGELVLRAEFTYAGVMTSRQAEVRRVPLL